MVEEIRSISFPMALRGYDRDAVDAYVEQVNRLIAELEISRSPESAVKHAVAQVSEETRGILERAHETAEEIATRSRAQADDRVQQAEREAAEVVSGAEQRVRDLDNDAEAIWAERLRLIGDVRDVADRLLAVADEAAARFPSAHPDEETQALPAGPEAEVFDGEVVDDETEVEPEAEAASDETIELDPEAESEPEPEQQQ
ncbi:MAG TPA: DivIVA domain-containing protein [Thermoleophilaceae bacterium]|jgi:DivIVA domain-containing protein